MLGMPWLHILFCSQKWPDPDRQPTDPCTPCTQLLLLEAHQQGQILIFVPE
jgi:hypothetical protein